MMFSCIFILDIVVYAISRLVFKLNKINPFGFFIENHRLLLCYIRVCEDISRLLENIAALKYLYLYVIYKHLKPSKMLIKTDCSKFINLMLTSLLYVV